MKDNILIIIGTLLTSVGVYQAVVYKEPHFYTLFSIGLFFIFYSLYFKLFGKSLFTGWKNYKIVLFTFFTLIVSIIIDVIGIKLGYWEYPYYNSFIDQFLKYLFEWTAPLIVYMTVFIIGFKYFSRFYNKSISSIFSLIIFVLGIGMITEYINSFVFSWKILKMPILDYTLGVFNLGFVTLGYWLMALIPYSIYSFLRGKK